MHIFARVHPSVEINLCIFICTFWGKRQILFSERASAWEFLKFHFTQQILSFKTQIWAFRFLHKIGLWLFTAYWKALDPHHVSKVIMIDSRYPSRLLSHCILSPLTADTHRPLSHLAWWPPFLMYLVFNTPALAPAEPIARNIQESINSTYRHWSKHSSGASSSLFLPQFCLSDVLLGPSFFSEHLLICIHVSFPLSIYCIPQQ